MSQLHATAIAVDQQGILLRGPSGAGKSDLALRLIEQGAQLISDDRVEVMKKGADLIAFAPPTIAGLFEVRHLGIIKLQHLDATAIKLVIDLSSAQELERMPEDETTEIDDVTLPVVRLNPFEASAAAKVSLALAVKLGHIERVE
ncbi:HPr kinase/phosphatase C-terminal domain-containing protein [Terasakiella sp. A23]|uniref:HPr kinase/phosphorylase n=1 Tax=Terasakiella sp. FCG-A23 TaxID=3080561 RepID=UPI002954EDE9|nr:HPr kinase/phosphatase C-terminal domain-containing protein [Terasakiella sp. A23]MDV7338402.1 HPr kinase/phosphatase C-terminal domain-containing protein [Terasakiella sp. A23]